MGKCQARPCFGEELEVVDPHAVLTLNAVVMKGWDGDLGDLFNGSWAKLPHMDAPGGHAFFGTAAHNGSAVGLAVWFASWEQQWRITLQEDIGKSAVAGWAFAKGSLATFPASGWKASTDPVDTDPIFHLPYTGEVGTSRAAAEVSVTEALAIFPYGRTGTWTPTGASLAISNGTVTPPQEDLSSYARLDDWFKTTDWRKVLTADIVIGAFLAAGLLPSVAKISSLQTISPPTYTKEDAPKEGGRIRFGHFAVEAAGPSGALETLAKKLAFASAAGVALAAERGPRAFSIAFKSWQDTDFVQWAGAGDYDRAGVRPTGWQPTGVAWRAETYPFAVEFSADRSSGSVAAKVEAQFDAQLGWRPTFGPAGPDPTPPEPPVPPGQHFQWKYDLNGRWVEEGPRLKALFERAATEKWRDSDGKPCVDWALTSHDLPEGVDISTITPAVHDHVQLVQCRWDSFPPRVVVKSDDARHLGFLGEVTALTTADSQTKFMGFPVQVGTKMATVRYFRVSESASGNIEPIPCDLLRVRFRTAFDATPGPVWTRGTVYRIGNRRRNHLLKRFEEAEKPKHPPVPASLPSSQDGFWSPLVSASSDMELQINCPMPMRKISDLCSKFGTYDIRQSDGDFADQRAGFILGLRPTLEDTFKSVAPYIIAKDGDIDAFGISFKLADFSFNFETDMIKDPSKYVWKGTTLTLYITSTVAKNFAVDSLAPGGPVALWFNEAVKYAPSNGVELALKKYNIKPFWSKLSPKGMTESEWETLGAPPSQRAVYTGRFAFRFALTLDGVTLGCSTKKRPWMLSHSTCVIKLAVKLSIGIRPVWVAIPSPPAPMPHRITPKSDVIRDLEKALWHVEELMAELITWETAGSIITNLLPVPGVADAVEVGMLLALVEKFRPVLADNFEPVFEELGSDLSQWLSDDGGRIADKEVAQAAIKDTEKEITEAVAKALEEAVARDAIKAIVKTVEGNLVHWIPFIGWFAGVVAGPVLFHHMADDLASKMREPYAAAIHRFRSGLIYMS